MTSKQIAQILSVLPKTVNTARYRMKKKIGLKENKSLEDFLRGI
jgi:DNA-binding CsgD family transcriptional regulator